MLFMSASRPTNWSYKTIRLFAGKSGNISSWMRSAGLLKLHVVKALILLLFDALLFVRYVTFAIYNFSPGFLF